MKPVFEAEDLEIRNARTSTGRERVGLVVGVRVPPGHTINDHAGRLASDDKVKQELDADDVADMRDSLTDWLRSVGRERE